MRGPRKALIALLVGGIVLTIFGVHVIGEPFQRNYQWLSWTYAVGAGAVYWALCRRERH